MPLPRGTTVDRYILEGVLGEGGMAVVYAARHRELGSLHAIKQLKIDKDSVQERLLQEGRLQSSLQHPNVVSVTDLISIEGAPALVMEYVKGPTLGQLLSRQKLSLVQCDLIARGILKGVAAAHAHGMVHRDLKPANILIASTGSEVIPKIADFGLAKVVEGEGDPHGLTKDGAAMGTPGYMAPEQLKDARSVDLRADVFALGAILYEMVCGRHCFVGDDVMAVWFAISQGQFIPPRSHVPELPERMVDAIEGALVVDRETRIANVSNLLERWCRGVDGALVSISPEALNQNDLESVESFAHSLTVDSDEASGDLPFDPAGLPPSPQEQAGRSPEVPSVTPPPSASQPDPYLETGAAGAIPSAIIDQQQAKRGHWFWSTVGALLLVGVTLLFSQGLPGSDSSDSAARQQVGVQRLSDFIDLRPDLGTDGILHFEPAEKALLAGDARRAKRLLTEQTPPPSESTKHGVLLSLAQALLAEDMSSRHRARQGGKGGSDGAGGYADLARLMQSPGRGESPILLEKNWQALRDARPSDAIVEAAYLMFGATEQGPKRDATYRAAEQRFPSHPVFAHLTMNALRQEGRNAEWLSAAEAAKARFPQSSGIKREVARAQLALGRLEEAQEILEPLAAADPSQIAVRLLLAESFVRTGDEGKRVSQMLLAMSDTVPVSDRVRYLAQHGLTLANHGQLAEANKLWRFCLAEAQKNKYVEGALDCALTALRAHHWAQTKQAGTIWLTQLEGMLAQSGLTPEMRAPYDVELSWLKGLDRLRQGDAESAELVAQRLQTASQAGGAVTLSRAFGQRLAYEIALASEDDAEASRRLERLIREALVFSGPRDCAVRYQQAAQALRFKRQADAKTAFGSVAQKICHPGAHHGVLLAQARVTLAELVHADGQVSEARRLLIAFFRDWARADETLSVTKRAKALQAALP